MSKVEIEIGSILYGFCNGFFGRDSYNDKTIEGIGKDWIVVRDTDGIVQIANFDNEKDMYEYLEDWMDKEE